MANSTENVFKQWVDRYHPDPVLFVQEVLGVDPDPWQIEFLRAIARGDRKISVRSGHGVGKSTASSWAMLWYFMTRSPVKVVVTAPTSSQLYDAMFAELKRWINAMPLPLQGLLTVKQERIEFNAAPTEMFISARTSRAEQPEALQGIHSEHVMLVADEASGVPEQVFEAAAGSMSGHNAVTLLLGNPVRSSGFFYDTHTRLAGEWTTFRVSCLDSPRVSDEYVKEMQTRYGEESNVYRIRVVGEFPKGDDDTVIAMDLLEQAVNRDVAPSQHAPIVWGLDVARFGSDRSALCKRQGNAVTESIKTWKNLDLMQLTGAVVAEYQALPPSQQPQEILVDSIGLGARWWTGCGKMAKDEVLIAELATVRYSFTSNGKIQIEGKDEIRKRGLPSPDKADAFVLTFASDAIAGMYGSAASSKWSQPLRRNLSRVA